MRTKSIYKGLLHVIKKFADDRKYDISISPKLNFYTDIKREEVVEFMDSLNLHGRGKQIEIREYQYEAVYQMLRCQRSISLAATSAGKSLMIYSKIRYHVESEKQVLLIVPTVNLVNQMYGDFEDYSSANGWSVADNVSKLYSGKERVFDSPVIISTWQTLASMLKSDPKNFKLLVDQIDVLICDEAHQFRSAVVSKTIEAFVNTEWRTGTSGTLDGTNLNELTLTGLLGPVYQVVTAKQMMDAGQVTPVQIKILLLKHPEHICAALKGMDYKEEINQIVANEARNKFIAKLAIACTGNTLILFNFVSRHGQVIYDKIRDMLPEGRNVYFIHGNVDVEERDEIRRIVETENNAIIVATSSLFATGTNIPSLENIIFAAPGKSNIRIRQSIGRGLRLKDGKTVARIFDIADDYTYKKKVNVTRNHLDSRVEVYIKEQFPYTLTKIDLNY
jgi:superfamily II DNA or RNA helicase